MATPIARSPKRWASLSERWPLAWPWPRTECVRCSRTPTALGPGSRKASGSRRSSPRATEVARLRRLLAADEWSWIAWHAPHLELQVEMRADGKTGAADQANLLALLDRIANLDRRV